jgi:hypothetical protein
MTSCKSMVCRAKVTQNPCQAVGWTMPLRVPLRPAAHPTPFQFQTQASLREPPFRWKKSGPKMALILVIAAAGGLRFGVAIALLWELMNFLLHQGTDRERVANALYRGGAVAEER